MKNYNNFMKHENGNLAVGFIKSRKAEHKVMDFCERLIAAGDEEGCEILCVDVDRGGSRDIDRPQLDDIYRAMEMSIINHLFIRSFDDISEDMEDLVSFMQFANDNKVQIHVVGVEADKERSIRALGRRCRMLNGFHNGEVENLLYLPEYKMYLAIDYDGVNVYDQYENFYGNYPTEEEAIEALARAKREGGY